MNKLNPRNHDTLSHQSIGIDDAFPDHIPPVSSQDQYFPIQ
jgi:hypothetical protein